jgi:MEMO1 family protein
MTNIRPPAVAGSFYPGNEAKLAAEIDAMLVDAESRKPLTPDEPLPKAIIVPHAGYIYSGPVAAGAYLRLRKGKGSISRVVLLGPVHRVPVHGLALSAASYFETPLGMIPLDVQAPDLLSDLPQVTVSDPAHALEHSLEVQLPFLQRVLGDFSLIPLAVGDARPEEVAQVLERLWGGPETLIVISSDLSHYLPHHTARRIDHDTVHALLDLQLIPSHEQACGATPVNGLIVAARQKRLVTRLIDLRNSGDTAGDKGRVVGYAAIMFYEEESVSDERGSILLAIARGAISLRLGKVVSVDESAPWLSLPGACFVTLTRGGELRGCIGTLEPYRSLLQDLQQNALAAAFRDPRFPPLTEPELESVRVEVSLLNPLVPILFKDEADALAQLRPGLDGVILEFGRNRGTFLPQVWEQLPTPREFFHHLKMKAGLSPAFWDDDIRLYRYTVDKYREES